MNLRAGQVWRLRLDDEDLGLAMVLSGSAYNELTGGTVLIVEVHDEPTPAGLLTVPVGAGVAVLDWVTYADKATFTEHIATADVQAMTDIHNLLFRILATS